jgi:hypothetical protein
MNNYRLLGQSLLVTLLLLTILTFQFGQGSKEKLQLILTYEVGAKFSMGQFRIFITAYFVILSGLAFWTGNRTELKIRAFWLYVSLLIIPLTVFTVFTMIPEWTILLVGNYRGNYSGSYYDYINDYGILNICLIVLNVLGLSIFGFLIIRKLKRM